LYYNNYKFINAKTYCLDNEKNDSHVWIWSLFKFIKQKIIFTRSYIGCSPQKKNYDPNFMYELTQWYYYTDKYSS
jgi:hypothetical protein